MPAAIVALMVANALSSYSASRTQAKMQGNYYGFLADQSRQKAEMAKAAGDQQASAFQEEGSRLTHQLKVNVAQMEASQKTGMIANGIELGSVTAEDISTDTLSKAKLDEMAIRYNADLKAYQAKRNSIMQAWEAYGEAGSMQLSGQMQASATRLQGNTTLIGNAANTGATAYSLYGKGGTTPSPTTQGYTTTRTSTGKYANLS